MSKVKNKVVDAGIEEKQLVKFLSGIDLFSNLTRSERKNLIKYFYIREYKAGEMVFKEGYPNVIFYIIRKGQLRVFLERKEEEVELNILESKDFFGEMGIFIDDHRTACVSAVEDTELLGISKKDLNNYIHRFPKAGVKVLKKLGELLCTHIVKHNNKLG